MTAGEVKQTVKSHRPAAVVGGVVGLILIVAWFGYDIAMTPARPEIARGNPAEVVAYIADARGLAKLSQIEQEQFLNQWKDYLLQPGHDEELRQCLETLPDAERKTFAEAIFRQAKRAFVDDAKRYAQQTTPEEKNKFIRDKLNQYASQAEFTKRVASGFKGNAPKSQDELQKWIIENTTAEERAVGEPYVEALKRVREMVKKEQRGAQAVTASTSGA